MTKKEALISIEELKGRFDAPFSSEDKNLIERLYSSVLGKNFVPTSCQQCYHDALIEVNTWIKKGNKMAEKMNYRLKAGAIINCPNFQNGKIYTNDNLTDKIASDYLGKFPSGTDLFQKVPDVVDNSKNVAAYKRLSAELDDSKAKLDEVRSLIASCKTHSEEYTGHANDIENQITMEREDLEKKNKNNELNDDSELDSDFETVIQDLVNLVKADQTEAATATATATD